MIQTVIGQKIDQTQMFLENGVRVPVSRIRVGSNIVIEVRTPEKHGYQAVQLGFGSKKNATKPIQGHIKGAKLEKAPLFLRETRLEATEELPAVGDIINPSDVLKAGDIVDVTGTSKGKGFAGGMKRHNFRGGPRTHGQSDRERAPGSIGQTTTPGRVYKGKRMAGNMGNDTVTIKNLKVLEVLSDGTVLIDGLIPGKKAALVTLKKSRRNEEICTITQRRSEGREKRGSSSKRSTNNK